MLKDKEIDLSQTQFTFTPSRLRAVDFSVPFRVDVGKLFIPTTGSASSGLGAYFSDFGVDFWVFLGVTLMSLATLIFLCNFVHETAQVCGSWIIETTLTR